MATDKPRSLLRLEYEEAAEAYLRSLPPEHFMEATPQATQRTITLESLDLLHARRPEIQLFNELLIQYPYGRQGRIRQERKEEAPRLIRRPACSLPPCAALFELQAKTRAPTGMSWRHHRAFTSPLHSPRYAGLFLFGRAQA